MSPAALKVFITEECDFPGVSTLTTLKVCIEREYHREAALEGWERARAWLEKEYADWGDLPWKKLPTDLRDARIEALAKEEFLAAVSQLLPDRNELPTNPIELYDDALEQGYLTIPLVVSATASQLAKIDGLTLEKYQSFIQSKRGGRAADWGFIKYDWSLHDETMVAMYRKLLRIARPQDPSGKPLPAIDHGKGEGSTIRQLRLILIALIVYRLLGRGGLSITDAIRELQTAGVQLPYTQNREQRWRYASKLATELLAALKRGEFREAIQRFVATRQARKIFLP